MNKLPKLVIFDCDGIITETAHLHFFAWKTIAFKEMKITLDDSYLNKFRGLSREDSLKLIMKNQQNKKHYSSSEIKELIDKKNKYYQELIKEKNNVLLLPGVVDFIKQLRQAGVLIALASTSRNSESLLKLHNIFELFDYIVNPNELQKHKPDPEIFLKAAQHFQIATRDCWGVEDAQVGVVAIKSAQMFCIGVGDKKIVSGADIILADTKLLNLQELLKEFNDYLVKESQTN